MDKFIKIYLYPEWLLKKMTRVLLMNNRYVHRVTGLITIPAALSLKRDPCLRVMKYGKIYYCHRS